MSIRVKYDTFTESLIMNNDTSSPSQIIIPNWAMDLITKDYKHEIDSLKAENAKLRELVSSMYRNMQGVLDCSTDTVFVNSIMTLRDYMDECMEVMAELGMPPRDYESRRRELGLED